MARGFWQIHYTTLSLPPTEEQAVKKGWYKSDVSQLSGGGEWAPACAVTVCLSVGLRIIGSLTKRREAELGSWDITESVGKAIDGKVWKHLRRPSDWQLIPTWKSMRQYHHICMCWRKSVCFNGALRLFKSTDVCVQSDEHNTTRWQRTCGVRWHVGWGLAHCWIFQQRHQCQAWFSFQACHLVKRKQKRNPVFYDEKARRVLIKIFHKSFWGDKSRTPKQQKASQSCSAGSPMWTPYMKSLHNSAFTCPGNQCWTYILNYVDIKNTFPAMEVEAGRSRFLKTLCWCRNNTS